MVLRVLLWLWVSLFAHALFGEDLRAGKAVWWGRDIFPRTAYSEHTNGVIEFDNEVPGNVVTAAAGPLQVLALKSDSTVIAFEAGAPAGLSNVVSIGVGMDTCWAIKRDGTVAWWGDDGEEAKVTAGLSNITWIARAGYRSYLALKHDGTVLAFRFDSGGWLNGSPGESIVRQVEVDGQILSKVVACTSVRDTPLVLKNDGTVVSLKFTLVDAASGLPLLPAQQFSTEVITIGGQPLSNAVALAGGGGHALALKRDGTVVAWGDNDSGESAVPSGLSNVTAIAADGRLSLALKSDGTVVAWGSNEFGQTSVPAGLSNVVAIAAGNGMSFAMTTGNVPASVFVYPHGRLEKAEREADLIFKGRVISTRAVTNASFPPWAKPYATQFRLISVLKGKPGTNEPIFWHYTGGPMAWGGGATPSTHLFETGQSYLVFAAGLDKACYLYSVPPDATNRPNEFRQLYSGGVMRTLDARPVTAASLKDIYWSELNLLLNDPLATNRLYAIDTLDRLSLAGRRNDEWSRSDDFKREAVLSALLPLITNANEQVALHAISCFATESNAAVRLAPYVVALVNVANASPSHNCRLAAIESLSGLKGESVSNSLAQLLNDPDEDIRVGAVRLLPRFPAGFVEPALRERVEDHSANVRSVVADVIGDEKFVPGLPILARLFLDPVGKDPLIKPLTIEFLRAGLRWSNIGDVHTSAGFALVKFDRDQVADILKTNLADEGFHISFVSKLAEKDAEPWLPELTAILEARIKYAAEMSQLPPEDARRFADPGGTRILTGSYAKCWEDIRQYLLELPPEKLSGGAMDRYLDLLDKTVEPVPGCPGCGVAGARSLYELYWTRGLTRRASEIRRRYDKTDGWWFDDFSQHNPR